jgi:hypothetical protein
MECGLDKNLLSLLMHLSHARDHKRKADRDLILEANIQQRSAPLDVILLWTWVLELELLS